METLKIGSKGINVVKLQGILKLKQDGLFGKKTEIAVKNFQMYRDLTADGIVGIETWASLFSHVGPIEAIDQDSDLQYFETNYDQRIEKYYLPKGEYVEKRYNNRYCFLHHTAGRENPFRVIDSWGRDNRGRVGTEFVLGGQSHTSGSRDYDGVMVQAFPEGNHAWHLGKTGSGIMNKASVGLEICSMGYLDNDLKTYVGSKCLSSQACKLIEPFKDKVYWHKYSDRQLEEIEKWINYIGERDKIDMRIGLKQWVKKYGPVKAFGFQEDAYYGKVEGLLTHTNVRKDKSDCYPDPGLVDVIMSIK
jgi:hypothetical protein